MNRQRVLVICPTTWDRRELRADRYAEEFEFIFVGDNLSDDPSSIDAETFVADVVQQYKDDDIAGVVGTHDYPGCIFAAAIAAKLGLPGPSTEALIVSQHKVWAREIQAEATPEATPAFARVEAGDGPPPNLGFPFFIKPIKAKASVLAQPVERADELDQYLVDSAAPCADFAAPFDSLIAQYTNRPPDAGAFVAESLIEGEQVTVECFVTEGRVQVMGIVDSVMYPGTMSFARFEYPSKHDPRMQARMADIAARAGLAFGFDQMMFNVELFVDRKTDEVFIIEVNSRMSPQFADLFEKVDGINSYDVQLALSLGQCPDFRRGDGGFEVATSFVMRSFEDRWTLAVPSQGDVDDVLEDYRDLRYVPLVEPDERLSDHLQQPESFRYCIINLGGFGWDEIVRRFDDVRARLTFSFAPPIADAIRPRALSKAA